MSTLRFLDVGKMISTPPPAFDGYVFWIGGSGGPVKIGWTWDHPQRLAEELDAESPGDLMLLNRRFGGYDAARAVRLFLTVHGHRVFDDWFLREPALAAWWAFRDIAGEEA